MSMVNVWISRWACAAVSVAWLGVLPAHAQRWLPPAPPGVEITESYGIQFSTIGDVGNPPCTAYELVLPEFEDPFDWARYWRPFGTVDSPYRIARSELTTEQWMEFLNAFAGTRPREWFDEAANADFQFIAYGPTSWGAFRRVNPGGPGYLWSLFDVSYAARVPVTDISLREAMMFCNWLHHGKPTSFDSLLDGVYDISQIPPFGHLFVRPIERRPGARFWIPSCDEWVKAAHFDPHARGEGVPGYWEFSPRRAAPLIYAPFEDGGEAAANFLYFEDHQVFLRQGTVYPTSSYPTIQSAYGLLDTAGCAFEMTDTLLPLEPNGPSFAAWELIVEGSAGGFPPRDGGVDRWPLRSDRLGYFTASGSNQGSLRIAAAVECVADFNGDGFVDFFDYGAFVACYEGVACPDGGTADLDRDGVVGHADVVLFVRWFEAGC